MFAWRLNSCASGSTTTYHETLFTTNPTLFCEMFHNILRDLEPEKEYIKNWDKLQEFNESELTTKYSDPSKYRVFDIQYICVYEIETIQILV